MSLKNLINEIRVNYGHLSLNDLKNSFILILSNYSYEENILKNAKKLITKDISYNSVSLKNFNVKFNF